MKIRISTNSRSFICILLQHLLKYKGRSSFANKADIFLTKTKRNISIHKFRIYVSLRLFLQSMLICNKQKSLILLCIRSILPSIKTINKDLIPKLTKEDSLKYSTIFLHPNVSNYNSIWFHSGSQHTQLEEAKTFLCEYIFCYFLCFVSYF